MAVSLKKQIEAARAKLDKAGTAVYAFAVDPHQTRFNECLRLATPEVREAYEAARDAVTALEDRAVATGKAWRGSFSLIHFYR